MIVKNIEMQRLGAAAALVARLAPPLEELHQLAAAARLPERHLLGEQAPQQQPVSQNG
jgi:hypothetical protein